MVSIVKETNCRIIPVGIDIERGSFINLNWRHVGFERL
jgi:hypothetical protein